MLGRRQFEAWVQITSRVLKFLHIYSTRQAGEDVLEFMEEGLINPTCALTVGLPKVNEALEFILKSKSPGKVSVQHPL